MRKIFIIFVSLISTISEITAAVNDLTLLSVDEVWNTDKLFTGIAYQLEHPNDSSINLGWDKDYGRFQLVNKEDPLDISTLFYLVHAGNGYYYLRNGALKDRNVQTRCIKVDEKRKCYIAVSDYPSSELLYEWYLFIQILASESTTSIYQLNNS
jgi:hypothetical protein